MTAEPGRPHIFVGAGSGVIWKNFGATPAKELEYWVSAKWYPPGIGTRFFQTKRKDSRAHLYDSRAPAPRIPSPGLFVPAADVERAMAGNGRVFFWGEAIYRDVLPDTPQRHFHFCLVVLNMPKAANEPATFNVYKPECNSSD